VLAIAVASSLASPIMVVPMLLLYRYVAGVLFLFVTMTAERQNRRSEEFKIAFKPAKFRK
jgi:hypothetical protein